MQVDRRTSIIIKLSSYIILGVHMSHVWRFVLRALITAFVTVELQQYTNTVVNVVNKSNRVCRTSDQPRPQSINRALSSKHGLLSDRSSWHFDVYVFDFEDFIEYNSHNTVNIQKHEIN